MLLTKILFSFLKFFKNLFYEYNFIKILICFLILYVFKDIFNLILIYFAAKYLKRD